jgi:hypothetical protein
MEEDDFDPYALIAGILETEDRIIDPDMWIK